jgi:hypothetical protein
MNPEASRISPYSFGVVVLVLMTSQYWILPLRSFTLDQPLVAPTRTLAEEDQILWSPAREHLRLPDFRYTENQSIRRMQLQLQAQTRELKALKSLRKAIGEDGMVLSVQTSGQLEHLRGEAILINAGKDYGVREGDWLISGDEVSGRVTSATQRASLVDPLTHPGIKCFVKIDQLEGSYIWEGQGEGLAHVRVRSQEAATLINASVFLHGPMSFSGALWVGKVVENRSDQRGGWKLLVVEGRKKKPNDILHILQNQSSIQDQLFAQRDRLHQLKKQVRRLEEDKLRMELNLHK